MKKQIEIEARGKIKNFDSILKKFYSKAKFLKEKDRFSLLYFRGEVPNDVSEIKNEEVDLRVRVTNKIAEIVLKYGTWGEAIAGKRFPFQLNWNSLVMHIMNLLWITKLEEICKNII